MRVLAKTRMRWALGMILAGGLTAVLACGGTTKTVEKIVEVPVEKIVTHEVIVEVPVEKIVIREVERVITKEVPVEIEKIVTQRVEKIVPQVVEKIVTVEVIKEVPSLAGFKRGGTLVTARPGEITTMDPHVESLLHNWRFRGAVYAHLTELDFETMAPLPGLARSWSFDTPTKLTLNLAKNATFHDGTPVTAEDVKFTIERAVDPEAGAWIKPYGAIVNSMDIADDHTITFNLANPSLGVLTNLWYVGIVSKATVEREGVEWLKAHENGAGPFTVESWQPDVEMRLKAHDGYYKPGQPYVDGLVVRIIPDESTMVAALRTKQIDHGKLDDNGNFKLLNTNPNLVIHQSASMGTYFIFINHRQPILQDVRVRRALSLGMNRGDILKTVGVGLGAVSGVIPPALGDYWTSPEDLPYMTQDIAEAKRLLADAGYAEGFDLPIITIGSNRPMTQIAELLAAQWSQLGLRAKVQELEVGAWVDDLKVKREYFVSTNSTFKMPDPDGLFIRYFHSDGDGANLIGWTDKSVTAEMDALVVSAGKELDPLKRADAYKEIQRLVADQVHSLTSFSPIEVDVTQKYVKNFEPHPSTIPYAFDQVWLDK